MDNNATEISHPVLMEEQEAPQASVVKTGQHERRVDLLLSRTNEAKSRARAHSEEIITLLNDSAKEDTEITLPTNPTDTREMIDQFFGVPLPRSEYISQSQHLLRSSILERARTSDESENMRRRMDSITSERTHVNDEIELLDQKNGIQKLLSRSKAKALVAKKANLDNQREQLNEGIGVRRKLISDLLGREKILLHNQDLILQKEVESQVEAIREEYDHLLRDIVLDGTVTAEIRSSYVEQRILPEVNQAVDSGLVSPLQREKFMTTLDQYLACNEGQEAKKESQGDVLRFLSMAPGFSEVANRCRLLFDGDDREIVKELVADIAINDISPINKAISQHNYERASVLREIVRNALKPTGPVSEAEKSIGNNLFRSVDNQPEDILSKMSIWVAVKSSKTAQDLFGSEISQRDGKIYTQALDKSLSGSQEHIRTLYFYPTPDALRNLVVIAAADYSKFRTYNANWVLNALKQRPDWGILLDEAEKKFPSLVECRGILDNWSYIRHYNHPEIQRAAQQLTRGIFDSQEQDPRLIRLATLSLPNNQMIDVLSRKGVIPGDVASNLREAGTLLSHLSAETSARRADGDEQSPHVTDFFFQPVLRESLFPLITQQGITGQSMDVIGRLDMLSKYILDNRDNYDLLGLITNSGLISRAKETSVKLEGALLLLDNFRQIDNLLSNDIPVTVTKENWQLLLMMYIRSHNHVEGFPKLTQTSQEKINNIFDDPQAKELCLSELSTMWRSYLNAGDRKVITTTLSIIPGFIAYCGRAGQLSQIESLSRFVMSVDKAFLNQTTAEVTKTEVFDGMRIMEEKFIKEKWSNDDRVDFYNTSRDILEAAPSLFAEYLHLFQKLSPVQMKQFAREIYPLYKTKLTLMETKNEKGEKTFNVRQLVDMRTVIKNMAGTLIKDEKTFDAQKAQLLGEIRGLFTDHFGIIKIPENFNPEHMRSITDVTMFLANLHGRTQEKETILGFYLSLLINDRWDDFRRGQEIDPDEYLIPEKSAYIKTLLSERQRLDPLTAENLGIPPEEMSAFLKILNQETQNVVMGNVDTVDVILGNIIRNLDELKDLDLYPDALDKQRMKLLLDHGNLNVNSAVAKMYQKLINPDIEQQISEDEAIVQDQVSHIIQENGLPSDPQTLKQYFQEGMKTFAAVASITSLVEGLNVIPAIDELWRVREPSKQVIDVFKKLGEEFTPTSGALALSQDLNYLDNLIVSRGGDLTEDERMLISDYVDQVRNQVIKLEDIYRQAKNKSVGLKQISATITNPDLREAIDEIDRAVTARSNQQIITSTITNNLNIIIENMRACLSCVREGANNDTNLSFGDKNKFYVSSSTDTSQKGSISDEIVFLEPIVRPGGRQEIAFVLDKVYGTSTPTILENHVDTIRKKMEELKTKFPGIKISIFVSEAAMSSGGTTTNMLQETFESKDMLVSAESVEVDVAASAAGDHYIELGGAPRQAGKRQVSGVLIS